MDNMEKDSPPYDEKHQGIISSDSNKENGQQLTNVSRVSPMKDDHVVQTLGHNVDGSIETSFGPPISLKTSQKSRIPININYSTANISSLDIETAKIDLFELKLYNPKIFERASSFSLASKISLDKNEKMSASSSVKYNVSSSTVKELMIRRGNKFVPPLKISEFSPIVPQLNKLNDEEPNKSSYTGTVPKTSNPFHQIKDMSTPDTDIDLKRYRKLQSNKYDLLATAVAEGAKRFSKNHASSTMDSTKNKKFIICEDIKKLADYVYFNNSASTEIKNRITFGLDAARLLEELTKTEETYKLPEIPDILDEPESEGLQYPTTSKQTKNYSLYQDFNFADDKAIRGLLTAAHHVLLAYSLKDNKFSHCSKEEQDAD